MMTAQEFEARITAWARTQPDVEALVQIGSRVQAEGLVDVWSDWDYQLIVRKPSRYYNRDWPGEIAPCWSAHIERTERGIMKLSGIFTGGWEADFVLLSAWQMKVVLQAMRFPNMQTWLPSMLRKGVSNLRLVASPGYRVVLGGATWEHYYRALEIPWPNPFFSKDEYQIHVAAFWRHIVWVAKKIMRGELRAAMRWWQVELRESMNFLLMEEARLEGRFPRPEMRKAEQWLASRRLQQTGIPALMAKRELATALLSELTLFKELAQSIAARRGFDLQEHAAMEIWLRGELSKIID